jgi:hypothetical protein
MKRRDMAIRSGWGQRPSKVVILGAILETRKGRGWPTPCAAVELRRGDRPAAAAPPCREAPESKSVFRLLSARGCLDILDGMWRTSTGTRTLVGSEAELVRQLLGFVYFQITVVCSLADEPFESGISLFDRLQASQQLALLAEVGQALLRADQPPPKLSSLREATVGMLFEVLRACVAEEIADEWEEEEAVRYWRSMVVQVCREAGDEHGAALLDSGADDSDAWDLVVESLADRILWDRDWEMEDLFADAIPERGRQLKRFLGIEDDYFRDIAPDPTTPQLRAVCAQLDALMREG